MMMVQPAGTQAIYTSSILDRLLRDAVTINQHAVAGPVMIEAAGQLKLGQQPTPYVDDFAPHNRATLSLTTTTWLTRGYSTLERS